MTLSEQQLDTLCNLAILAGNEIMAVYENGGEIWQKADASPVTEADLRADAVIRKGLETEFPDTFILSEESSSAQTGAIKSFFLVDPLDGTKEFLKRNGEFTVNIALVHDSRPVAGIVYAPALDTLYFAATGLGAWKRQQQELKPLQTTPPPATMRVVGSRSHGAARLEEWLASINRPYRFEPAGSSLKFCRIAEGLADLYPRFGPTSQWDTAAAQCVLEIAGGQVIDLQGQALSYGLDRPILNPEFIAISTPALLKELGF